MIRFDRLGYPILIEDGLIDKWPLPDGKLFLVTDRNVEAAGWPDRLRGNFVGRYSLPPGEAGKSLSELERLIEAMLDCAMGRTDHVVAVGGGAVSDVAGFAAAVMKRGCAWIAVPTTLLAQADSAIGGKTGVNTRHGKNLIGAIHAPSLVLIDPQSLSTLDPRQIRSGYAEVVKYGLIANPDFFGWCEANGEALIEGDSAARLKAIATCIEEKARHVAGDERDLSGQRALLNFGHSFGHAIEAETDLLHGEAVSIGMAMAFQKSVELGFCAGEDSARAIRHLESSGLPVRCNVDPETLEARMSHDKKGGAMILTRGIGQAFLAPAPAWTGMPRI